MCSNVQRGFIRPGYRLQLATEQCLDYAIGATGDVCLWTGEVLRCTDGGPGHRLPVPRTSTAALLLCNTQHHQRDLQPRGEKAIHDTRRRVFF